MTDASARETIETDVVIVGAGPAGLAAAIRLKQAAPDLSVTVIEKAAEVGGHILSGAVMDPAGMDALLPGWRDEPGAPATTPVVSDRMIVLGEKSATPFPEFLIPPLMKTKGAVILSLGELCRWLAERAEALGVDIFPATAAVDVITDESGAIGGIVTGDLGRARDGSETANFVPGIGLAAKYTLVAEGARGSLSKGLIARFGLAEGKAPQKYGLGIKEIWRIDPSLHEPGKVEHFMGFPLGNTTSGGGFCYHAHGGRIFLGLVAHLDYDNPTFSPFEAFQRFKTHPHVARLLEGAECLGYGARALTSGGWQSIPKLAFPGGALIGCAAGFMNVPRLKAIHNAIRSGMAAADAVAGAIAEGRGGDTIAELDEKVLASGIRDDLYPVRAVKPLWARFGTRIGVGLSGLELWAASLAKTSLLSRLGRSRPDYATLKPISDVTPIVYPAPDGKTTFSRSHAVHLANIAHDEDQPVHLKLRDPDVPIQENLPRYGEPAPLYCPAGVYEVSEVDGKPVFRIHAQNCVHCKTCDIKDPAQNIDWVPPEGGSGPNYAGM